MSQRANPVKIGTFVVVALMIAVLATLVLGSGRLFRRTYPFVLYFDGSVNGLREGAAVKFKGVSIGKVTRIRLPITSEGTDLPIPVVIELDGDKLESWRTRDMLRSGDTVTQQIERGLRAKLESESFVTGVLFVSLKYDRESPAKLHDPIEELPEIPTLPTDLEEFQNELSRILKNLQRIDFNALVDQFTRAVQAISELATSPEIRNAVRSLDETLKEIKTVATDIDVLVEPLAGDVHAAVGSTRATLDSVRALAENIDRDLGPLLASAKANSEQLHVVQVELATTLARTRSVLDPEAPLVVQLESALREVGETARATRVLVEELERDPSALLRGKSLREEKP